MGKPTGFKEFERLDPDEMPANERVQHFGEFLVQLPTPKLQEQGARCMDCGVPFCHSACPLGNLIPEWNDLVYRDDWRFAYQQLDATNNFPEFTGRLCPAPCEESCVLALTDPPVTIKNIELAIIDRAFEEGWVKARMPKRNTQKRVAIIGSGPAGLAAAEQLTLAGHEVVVFERADRPGGLLRYGIPDFKLNRATVDRRIAVLEEEGIVFRCGVEVGVEVSVADLRAQFHAVVIAIGATQPRELKVPGRELAGVHYAMDFLAQQNARVMGNTSWISDRWWFSKDRMPISATGKDVIVVGGGDSGADCVGVCHRQGAKSVTQFEWKDMPSEGRPVNQPWPFWPMRLRTSTSHEEGGSREWGLSVKDFVGQDGRVSGLNTGLVRWERYAEGRREMFFLENSEKFWEADLVLVAAGFSGPERSGLLKQLGVEIDSFGRVATDAGYQTSVPQVFACGDAKRGQSLIVWAISEGRELACAVDRALMGYTSLPSKGEGDLLAA